MIESGLLRNPTVEHFDRCKIEHDFWQWFSELPFFTYLTGSHYFGSAKPGSDWDFFILNNLNNIQYLEAHGFVTLTGEESLYKDTNTVCVLRRNVTYTSPSMIEHQIVQVDIQVVRSADHKLRVQKALMNSPIAHSLMLRQSKPLRRRLWDLFYKLVEDES